MILNDHVPTQTEQSDMSLHYRARSVVARFRPLSAAYRNPSVARFLRDTYFRIARHHLVVTVELSSICNAKCIFCPYPRIEQSGKPLTRMPGRVLDHVIARLKAEGVHEVSLTPTTGELLIHPGWADAFERVAEIETVSRIHIYTNAILLKPAVVERMRNLKNVEKMVLSISVGGIDRAGYAELFGVDRFVRVQRNVRTLMREFAEAGMTVPVSVEVRLTHAQRHASIREARRAYGADTYRHGGVKLRRAFDPVGGLVDDPRLRFYRPRRKSRPCQLLDETRFAADGSVWLCGHVMSEQPGDTTLQIGRYDDAAETLAERRSAIVARWRDDGIAPGPCVQCTFHYLPARGSQRGETPMFAIDPKTASLRVDA